MTEITIPQELAKQAIGFLKSAGANHTAEALKAYFKPEPMSEVSWSACEHFLAPAITAMGTRVYMVGINPDNREHVLVTSSSGPNLHSFPREVITPTEGDKLNKKAPTLYKDDDGDIWEEIDGRWVWGDTRETRIAKRNGGITYRSLPEDEGPFTEVVQ